MADDYKQLIEDFFDSIDTIAEARVKDLKFNKTVRCEIVDTTKKDKGEYIVTDGSTKFKAYSDNTHYVRGDYVNVTIPNGDYSAQKMITGRCMTSEEDVFNYVSPLKSYIDITQNLIEDNVASAGLVANGQKSCVTLWEKNDFGGVKSYQRLGLKADFKVWLSNLRPVEGNYGLRLTVVGRMMHTTQTSSQLKVHTFTLDSNDMYGDPYNFDAFFTQEKVFDISEIPQIESMKLEFYQKQNFKNKQKKYIAHEDTFGYSLGQNLFVQNPYVSLGYATENYSNDTVLLYALEEDTYANYLTAEVKQMEMEKVEEINQQLKDLKLKQDTLEERYQFIIEELDKEYGDKTSTEYKNRLYKINQEYNEKKFLYQHQYEMIKNELDLNDPEKLQEIIREKNLKNIYLRWIHKDEESGRMIGIQSQDAVPEGAKIHWYRYSLKEGLTDPIAGPFWEEIDTSTWDSPFIYRGFQPDIKASSEQLRAIVEYKSKDYVNYVLIPNDEQIIRLDEEINKGTATDDQKEERDSIANSYLEQVNYYMSDILTFKNESEVASEATLSLIKDLVIKCDEAGNKGVYNLYNSAGALISQIEGQKKRILSASYNTLITGDNTIDLPETVTWRIPLVNTMIYPPTEGVEYSTYSQVSLTKTDDFVIGTHYKLSGDDYVLLTPTDQYKDTDKYFIKNKIDVKTADDGSYIDITRYGAVTSRIAGTEEADSMEQYFRIKSQYSQNLTNNTVYCIVNKNNKNFEASYTMHFGPIGTNGTDYTFTLEIDNAVPAMTWNPKTGITVKPKILNHVGKDITEEFAESKFVYSWYSPTQSGDVGLTQKQDGKNCILNFANTTTAIKQAYHHILQCQTTVDINYKTNKVTTSINTNNNAVTENVAQQTTSKPVTLTAYLPIPIRSSEDWVGFAGADQICYSNVGTNPEYYRNQYELYYYDKENKRTKVQPNYQKVDENNKDHFDSGKYYTQTFDFTEVAIGSQEELQPDIHYKMKNGFIKVTDDMEFDTSKTYYAKTADNKYIEIDIHSNGQLHKGQYYIRKDEYVVATDEQIFANAEQFYIKEDNGKYTPIDSIVDNNGNIKGRYYTFDKQEYVEVGAAEVYNSKTHYYTNNYVYNKVNNPTEAEYKSGEYYLADLGYVKISGANTEYDSNTDYYILGVNNEYEQITTLTSGNYKAGKYYTLNNNSYTAVNNDDIYYYNNTDTFYIKDGNNRYHQVDIKNKNDLQTAIYYSDELAYNRVAANAQYNSATKYEILDIDGEYHKVEMNISHIFPQGRYYYNAERYEQVAPGTPYKSGEQYYYLDEGEHFSIYFKNETEYLEYEGTLFTKELYKDEILDIDNHNYSVDNQYFVQTNYTTYVQVEVLEKEDLLLSPYFVYGKSYYVVDTYSSNLKYYLKTIDNEQEVYVEVPITSAAQLQTCQYYYKNANSQYIAIKRLFDPSEAYYVQTANGTYTQIYLTEEDNLQYGIYYVLENIYFKTLPEIESFNTEAVYYTRQLTANYTEIIVTSQEDLNTKCSQYENFYKLIEYYTLLTDKNQFNSQIQYYQQQLNQRFVKVTIHSADEIVIISNFYIIKPQYRLITEKDVFKLTGRYFIYHSETQKYEEVDNLHKTSDFIIGTHYILEDGYYAITETDTFSSTAIYYIKDTENNYYEVLLSSNDELQKGLYYVANNEIVLVTSDDVYDPEIKYYLPGNIVYTKATGTYDKNNTYYICIAKWKMRLGKNTGYDYSKATTEKENAKIAKCYPMMSEDNTLVPLAMFIQETKPEFSAVCFNEFTDTVLWVQPIRMYMNAYSSQLLNAWNGELTIDENNGTILSSLVGAGKKDNQNRFNGILMGDMTKASDNETATEYYTGTGLYGYNAGIKSFGLNINGRAFFGKAGRGQILIDGNSGVIKSARYAATESKKNWSDKEGILINLDSGLIKSHATDSSATIFIDPNNGEEINKDKTYNRGYFRINSANNNCLMFIGKEDYYLRTDDYQARELDDDAPAGKTKIKTPGKGLYFNLADGKLTGYNFAITAYADEKAGTYNTDDIKYISINSKAQTYPLKVGNKFSVDWNGKITSTGGTIGGWVIQDKRLYRTFGRYTVSLRKAEESDTKVIGVWDAKANDGKGWYNFSVQANGKMLARNAEIKGKVTATEGVIGGAEIKNGKLDIRELYIKGSKIKVKSNVTLVTDVYFYSPGSAQTFTGYVITGVSGKTISVRKLTWRQAVIKKSKITVNMLNVGGSYSSTTKQNTSDTLKVHGASSFKVGLGASGNDDL